MTAVAGPRINSFLQRLLVQARVSSFEEGVTYHQEYADGSRSYFKAGSKNKNGSWKGQIVDSRRPKKTIQGTANIEGLNWNRTPKAEVPAVLAHVATAAIPVVAATYTASEQKQIATTIIQQLGGNKFTAMTGAKYSYGEDEDGPYLYVRIGRNAKGIGGMKVALNRNDEYDVTFIGNRVGATSGKPLRGVPAENLRAVFTQHTGMETSLGTGTAGGGGGHNSAGGTRVHPPAAQAGEAKIARALADYGKTYREYMTHIKAGQANMDATVKYGVQDLYNQVKGQKPDQIVDAINYEIEHLKKAMKSPGPAGGPDALKKAADAAWAKQDQAKNLPAGTKPPAAPEKPKRGRPAAAPAAERHAQMKGGKAAAPAPAAATEEPKAKAWPAGKSAWVETAKIGGHTLHILYKKNEKGNAEVVHGFAKKEDADREAKKLNDGATAPAPAPKAAAPKAPAKDEGLKAPTKKTAGPKPPGPPSAAKAPAPAPKAAPKAPAKADPVPADIKALAKRIADLTGNNDHTEAAMALAKFLKHPRAVKDLTETQKVQRARGHMPANLRQNRDEVIVPTLIKLAAKKFGAAAGKLLHGAF